MWSLNEEMLSEKNWKLAKTICGVLDYKHMKNTVIKIFGNPCGSKRNSSVDPLPIKEECFLDASIDRYQPNKEDERKYKKDKLVRFKMTDVYDRSDRSDKNPVGQDGNILRCFRCDSARNLTSKSP